MVALVRLVLRRAYDGNALKEAMHLKVGRTRKSGRLRMTKVKTKEK